MVNGLGRGHIQYKYTQLKIQHDSSGLTKWTGSVTSCRVKSNSTVRFQSTLKTQDVSLFVDIYHYSLNSHFIMFLFFLLLCLHCCDLWLLPLYPFSMFLHGSVCHSPPRHPSPPSFHSEQPEKSLEIYSLYFPPVTGDQALNLSNPPITQELTMTIW